MNKTDNGDLIYQTTLRSGVDLYSFVKWVIHALIFEGVLVVRGGGDNFLPQKPQQRPPLGRFGSQRRPDNWRQ